MSIGLSEQFPTLAIFRIEGQIKDLLLAVQSAAYVTPQSMLAVRSIAPIWLCFATMVCANVETKCLVGFVS